MVVSVSLIVAACSNRGIGINGKLPWKLSGDMAFFKRVTSRTKDITKQNAVIMGRKTWDSIPTKFKPLSNRINIILSTTVNERTDSVYTVQSFEGALNLLSSPELRPQLEEAFVIGGESVYRAALESGSCRRIYMTEVLKEFECDTFLPEFDLNAYQPVQMPDVTNELQSDSATQVQFRFTVYERFPEIVKTTVPLFVSVAMDSNRGFGRNGDVPWTFKKEFEHFISMISHTSNPDMKVAVIKGRKTWESTCQWERTLPSVINIIISRSLRGEGEMPKNVWQVVESFPEALQATEGLVRSGKVEKIWVLGGTSLYQEVIDLGLCQRIYITRIHSTFDCDVFFPLFEHKYRKVSCESVEEDGVTMDYEIYELHENVEQNGSLAKV